MKMIVKKLAQCALVAGLVLASGFVSKVHADEAQNPSYGGGIRMPNLEFIGAKSTWTILATGSKQLVIGQGELYAICPFGGTLGKYSLAFDSAVNGNQYTADSVSTGYGISPNVYTSIDSTSAGQSGSGGCWVPRVPQQFLNGLVGVQNNAGHLTLFIYRRSGSLDTNP